MRTYYLFTYRIMKYELGSRPDRRARDEHVHFADMWQHRIAYSLCDTLAHSISSSVNYTRKLCLIKGNENKYADERWMRGAVQIKNTWQTGLCLFVAVSNLCKLI